MNDRNILSIFVDESGNFSFLIEQKMANGLKMTKSEDKFFGGPRNFKRNVLKVIKRKEV